ncbi:MAG TPA: hypothetical protein VJ927_02210 [Actinomycetota bacterium]|nr:hypothetical protein [Actinomycetota bacterium]
MSHDQDTSEDKVLRLPPERDPEPVPEASSPPGRLHGAFIAGMAVSALIGTAAMFVFITVGWPESTQRYVVGIMIVAVLSFLTCASAAVFTAARETYPTRSPD